MARVTPLLPQRDGGGRAMILFTPLSGAQGEGPLCYLLELDDFKLLLDCGWNDSFEPAQFDSLKAYVPRATGQVLQLELKWTH